MGVHFHFKIWHSSKHWHKFLTFQESSSVNSCLNWLNMDVRNVSGDSEACSFPHPSWLVSLKPLKHWPVFSRSLVFIQHLCYPLSSLCFLSHCPTVFHQPYQRLFQSNWTSQWGYRFLTCLHLPPRVDWSAGHREGSLPSSPLPFSPSQPTLSVFTTSDPRPWQHLQECQEWLAG